MNKNNCIFCDIINQKIPSKKIYENNLVYVFLDSLPNSNGHTLIIPKKHFKYYSITEDKYLIEVIKIGKIIAQKIYKTLNPIGINYIINEKSGAYQKIFHYHFHIIPKYKKNEGYNPNININKKNIYDLTTIQKILTLN